MPAGARWAARVYLLEHERIALLADEYEQRVQAVTAHPPQDELARRHAVLRLLDAARTCAMCWSTTTRARNRPAAQELPLELQQAAWADEPAS